MFEDTPLGVVNVPTLSVGEWSERLAVALSESELLLAGRRVGEEGGGSPSGSHMPGNPLIEIWVYQYLRAVFSDVKGRWRQPPDSEESMFFAFPPVYVKKEHVHQTRHE